MVDRWRMIEEDAPDFRKTFDLADHELLQRDGLRPRNPSGGPARTTSVLLRMMDPEIVAAWIEGNGGVPTPELIRRRQFYYHCGTAMIAMEDYFSQHEHGLFNQEQFARGSATFRQVLKKPGLRAYWLRQREVMIKAAPCHRAFIDRLCAGETAAVGDWAS